MDSFWGNSITNILKKVVMKIILIRHGPSEIKNNGLIKVKDFSNWIQLYDESGVFKGSIPPIDAMKAIKDCNAVYTSNLKRSIQSAKILGLDNIVESSPVFRECDIPKCGSGSIRIPTSTLTLFYRVLWLLGYGKNCESKYDAKLRAKVAAKKLISSARNKGFTVFVGHGFINRYISSILREEGWNGPINPGRNNWGFGTYSFLASKNRF